MKKTKWNLSLNDVVLKRRERVAYYRSMGFTCSEIMDKLTKEGYVNPKNDKPWSKETVMKDFDAIREIWKEECAQSVENHRNKQLANLNLVLSSAWKEYLRKKENNENCVAELDLVNKTHDRISKLLGTNEPDRLINEDNNEIVKIEIVHKTEEKP